MLIYANPVTGASRTFSGVAQVVISVNEDGTYCCSIYVHDKLQSSQIRLVPSEPAERAVVAAVQAALQTAIDKAAAIESRRRHDALHPVMPMGRY